TLALVTEPNRRAVSTSNSLGVSRRCMKVETEPRPPPMMMPTSSITCMLAERPRSSQPYSSTDSATIATTCSRNCSVSCSIVTPATPRKYTAAVWIAVYRDSKPMIDGVMMRLLVTVWKAMVAVAWQNAATPMTTSEVTRTSATSQRPLEPTGIGSPTASRPSAKPPAVRTSAVRTIQERRRADASGKGPKSARGAPPGPRDRAVSVGEVAMAPVAEAGEPDTSRTGWKTSDMAPLPQDHGDEHGGAQHAQDQGDRHLEGHDDGAGDQIAQGDDGDAEQGHPGQVAAQVVP